MDSQESEKKQEQRENRRPPIRPEMEYSQNQYQHSPYQRREFPMQPFYPQGPIQRRGSFIEEERLPDIRLIPDTEKYSNSLEVKNAIDFIQRVKAHYSEESQTFIGFLETMHDFKSGKLKADDVVTGVAILFGGNDQLLAEFKKFVPPAYHNILKSHTQHQQIHHQNMQNQQQMYVQSQPSVVAASSEEISRVDTGSTAVSAVKSQKYVAAEFISLVKQRLDNKGQVYEEFIKILSGLKDNPNHEQSFGKIEKCLEKYPDLLAHFYKFLPFDRPISIESDSNSTFLDRVKSLGVYEDFMKCINAFNQNLLSSKDLMTLIRSIITDEEALSEIKKHIKYDEVDLLDQSPKNINISEKYGSYRILPEHSRINYDDNGDVLNRTCILCLTQDREDQNYIFLKRNIYEENLFRIEDERYDSDLTLGRLEFFILSLEKILGSPLNDDAELSISHLEMSAGVIKELLMGIYGDIEYIDVIDSIQYNHKEAIPIVLNRLYQVYKQWNKEKIEKNRIWEEATKDNYYKALDSIYYDFKHQDKKLLSYKMLARDMIKTWDISNKGIFTLITELVVIFAENGGFAEAEFIETITSIIHIFSNEKTDVVFYTNPFIFCIFSYIIILYERLKEALEVSLPPISSSNLAVELGLIQPRNVENRREEIIRLIRDYLGGKIKNDYYEEELRIVSNNHAYKLFNIDKIMSKIEDRVVNVHSDVLNKEILEDIFMKKSKYQKIEQSGAESIYKFSIKNNEMTIDKVTAPTPTDTSKFVEKFRNLEYDAENIKTKVFLESKMQKYNGGYFYFNVEHRVCPKTMILSYIGGTEDFFMRYEHRRCIDTKND